MIFPSTDIFPLMAALGTPPASESPDWFVHVHARFFEWAGWDAERAAGYLWAITRMLWWSAGACFLIAMLAGHIRPVPEGWGMPAARVFPFALMPAIALTVYTAAIETKGVATLRVEIPLPPAAAPVLNDATRLELLKTESELLQSRFDKYDQLVFQLRGWVMTIAVGAVTAHYVIEDHPVVILNVGAAAALGFAVLERRWRIEWNAYVQRYKFLRRVIHDNVALTEISPLDLTNKYRRDQRLEAFEARYGDFVGPMLARATAGPEQAFPQSTAREMMFFYAIVIGLLLFLSGALRSMIP